MSGVIENLEGEIWKDIVGYDHKYMISNNGRVYAPYRNRILKPYPEKFGYLHVNLIKNKKQKLQYIHRLVAIYFLDNMEGYKEVNHIDNNPKNNHVSNLEWVSPRENSTYKWNKLKRSSKYTGVSWDKSKQKWRSTIYLNGKQIHIGRYDNEEAASFAYKNKLKEINDVNKYMI